jgi:hypothetical protein
MILPPTAVLGTLIERRKPLPMLYEEIFLSAIQTKMMDEKELKIYIAGIVSNQSK